MTPTGDAPAFFQALGDPTRLALLALLRTRERTVGEMVEALGAPQPRVSRHLKVLRNAGLVADRREGRFIRYGLTPSSSWSVEIRDCLRGLLNEREAPRRPRGRKALSRREERPLPAAAPAPEPRQEVPAPGERLRSQDIETHLL
ncbi:MAG: metalloregulator ArsR/SmtB family transcription factor [Gemmatimonadota bacterium]|jgi:DNA-binding transcriptional ArsR family regulator|nr:metalloregulator ArsR/SmtB family transcription factor [Gemmatimonadota bacterium]MDP7030941.1 metalloregulator ArsR/SmtB family transcription factor [Gemmatimonadota bacterium]